KTDNRIFNDKDIRLFRSISILVNNHYANKKISEIQSNTQNSIIISLVKMLELFDSYTKGHSEQVAELSRKTAIKMNIKDVEAAYWAGMVHDIGKILVDRKILNKESNLNFEEYEIIKNHSYWGYEVLNKSEELKDIAKYVLHHHERYDGMGYPDGLKGEEIPIISQIIAVVDSYDTMVSKRAYKEPLTIEEALNELIENRGTQFSKEVVDVFVKEVIIDNNKILKSRVIN
ncbi:MAG: HD-GYP domain-containing protein, partial [Bacillota bacterium]|nr:HD-GYP domain-containing protein [Bacillota bacterium]